jgi:hypothetical protein
MGEQISADPGLRRISAPARRAEPDEQISVAELALATRNHRLPLAEARAADDSAAGRG